MIIKICLLQSNASQATDTSSLLITEDKQKKEGTCGYCSRNHAITFKNVSNDCSLNITILLVEALSQRHCKFNV